MSSHSSGVSESSGAGAGSGAGFQNRDFKLVLEGKGCAAPVTVHLVAPTVQEKAAWISDISQVTIVIMTV